MAQHKGIDTHEQAVREAEEYLYHKQYDRKADLTYHLLSRDALRLALVFGAVGYMMGSTLSGLGVWIVFGTYSYSTGSDVIKRTFHYRNSLYLYMHEAIEYHKERRRRKWTY